MRNLKRALSLTLASVMLLGMMVVGSSAASYPDVSDEDNVEAIEVLQKVAVMEGDNNGNFNPDDYVTREQMAVIMSKLLNLNYAYYQGTNPFSDVPAWAAPYVAACAANGITSGIGGGMYGAGQNVNAVQAALMMLKALGYFQYQEDFGDSYILATVKQATEVGLFDMIDSKAEQALTRNEVAQMALNALKSEMVTFTGDVGTKIPTAQGDVVVGYRAEYTARTSTETKYQAIERRTSDVSGGNNLNRGQYYIQLGEQLYDGDLRLSDNTLDDFGRPARTWAYQGEEIGTYAKKELLVDSYILSVKGSEIYAKLGQDTIRRYDLDAYVDGYLCGHNNDASSVVTKNELVRSNDKKLAITGRGVLTELYRDDELGLITIVSINTYLAKADIDYNENTETVSLTVYNDVNGNGFAKVADIEDVPNITGLKKDDWCLVQWADRSSSASNKVIVKVMDTEIMTDKTVTGFSSSSEDYSNWSTPSADSRKVTKITSDGTTYDANQNANYDAGTLNKYSDDRLVNKTYNIFMDQYGNFIGAELYSGKDQYVFITGYDLSTSAIAVNTAKANGIFADGTMSTIEVNVKDTNANIGAIGSEKPGYTRWSGKEPHEEMWYRYTEDKGVYTLAPVDGWTRTYAVGNDVKIDCSNVRLVPTAATAPATNGTGNAYGEDASVYITVEEGYVDLVTNAVTDVTGVYTGVQSVKLVRQNGQWAHAVYDSKNNYIVACVVLGEAEGIVDNYAYIRSGAKDESVEVDSNGDRTFFWKVDVIMNGVKDTKTIKSKYANTTQYLRPGAVQELVMDADGYVTKINDVYYSDYTGTETADPTGTADKKDKVFSNFDFIYNGTATAATNNKFNSTDLADYSVYDINVSTAAFNAAVEAKNNKGEGAKGQASWGYYNNLAFQGSTLIYDSRNDNDRGLTVMQDAKAVIYHTVKQDWTYEEYPSVGAAFTALRDADNDTTTNTTNLKQFSGRIVAVLNSTGRAEWVFFIDNTPEQVTDPGYGGGSISGTVLGANAGLKDVNDRLAAGENVVIDGSWRPYDLTAANNVLYLPNNRTLTILGDFNAYLNDGVNSIQIIRSALNSGTVGKLVVGSANGTAAARNARLTLVQDVDFNVEARNMTIGGASAIISGNVHVYSNLKANLSTTLTVNGVVTVDGILDGSATGVIVNGTLTVEDLRVATTVRSANTLRVTGVANAAVTVENGGRAIIKKMASSKNLTVTNGTATVAENNGIVAVTKGTATITENKGTANVNNADAVLNVTTLTSGTVTATSGTASLDAVNGGTVTVNGGAATIKTIGKDATLSVSSGSAKITEKLDTQSVTISSTGTVTLAKGTTIGENASVKTTTSNGKEVTGSIKADTTIGDSDESSGTLTVPGNSIDSITKVPTNGQPTTVNEAKQLNEMPALAEYTTLNLKEAYNADNNKVVVSGSVMPVDETKFKVDEVAMTAFAPGSQEEIAAKKLRGWEDAAEGDETHTAEGFKTVYKLGDKYKAFGFINVNVGGKGCNALVGLNATGNWVVISRALNGDITEKTEFTFESVTFVIDLK